MPLVTEFLAETQGRRCSGLYQCRWCGAACSDRFGWWLWPPTKEKMKCPSSQYVCHGCHLYKRSRTTLSFLDGSYLDRQDARNHSWLLRADGLTALRRPVDEHLADVLLAPPRRFALSLMEPDHGPNLVQFTVLNDNVQVDATTPLRFTLNGSVLEYTVYELQEALANGGDGKEPGVRVLLAACGGPKEKNEKRGRGRPPVTNRINRTVTASGAPG